MGFSRQEYWSGVPLPSSLIVREMQTKTMVRYHFIPIKILLLKKKNNNRKEQVSMRK